MGNNSCARCGQDLRLAEDWPDAHIVNGAKGDLCPKCAISLSDEEQSYY